MESIMNKNNIIQGLKDSLVPIFRNKIQEEKLTFKGDINCFKQVTLRWLDYKVRYITQKPRKVYYANSFPQKLKFHTHRALTELVSKIQLGLDINPYLSNTLITNDTSHLKSQQRTDKFYAHFGIHHFHLPINDFKDSSDFLNNRKNNCWLFAIISKDWAGLIDITPHTSNNFYDLKHLESIYDSWPEILEPYRLKNVYNAVSYTDTESIKKLRNADINTTFPIRNNYYMSPFGITGYGTNSITTDRFLKINELLTKLASSLLEPNSFIAQSIQFNHASLDPPKLLMHGGELYLSYKHNVLKLTQLYPYNQLYQIIELH